MLLGLGNGTFDIAVNHGVGISPRSLTSSDFDNDCKLDLAIVNYQNADITILLGTGDGNFITAANYGLGRYPDFVTVGDLEGDGDIDLIASYSNENNFGILTIINEASFQCLDEPPQNSKPRGSGGHSDKRCFIATAAYGSYLSPEVVELRAFRDKYLMSNMPGRLLVKMYYRFSPPAANFIAKHESVRTATRISLTLVIYLIKYPMAMGIFFCSLYGITVFGKRRITLIFDKERE